MDKRSKYIAVLLIVIVISFIVFLIVNKSKEEKLGGEIDEYGCLGPAGYTFNKEVGACLREWEFDDNQKRAAKIAVDYVGAKKGLTVIKIYSSRCPGCYVVYLKDDVHEIKITFENWEITEEERTLTISECKAKGGKPLDVDDCGSGKESVGEVTGFGSPHICCADI